MKNTMTGKVCLIMLMGSMAAYAEINEYAGLWVGSVSLTTVNEVSIPFDENNVAQAPNPLVPTATSDRADLKLIIHVDAAGQVSLLKDVAIVNRNPSGDPSMTIADIVALGSDEFSVSLVTDPARYADYPMQKATRYTSVVYDFGDAQATSVLDAIVDKVVDYVVFTVKGKSASAVNTIEKRNQVAQQIVDVVSGWSVSTDNVASAYQVFLQELRNQDAVPLIAASPSPTGGAASLWMTDATKLFGASSFGDARAIELVTAIQKAGTTNNSAEAWNMAARFADTSNTVVRLLSGKIVGDALVDAAKYAAMNSGVVAADLKILTNAVLAITAAQASKGTWNNDTRATGALTEMFDRIATTAQAGHAAGDLEFEIQANAYAAGWGVLKEALSKYPTLYGGPTTDYMTFVTSAAYGEVPAKAAAAAAKAALIYREKNPLTYESTMWASTKAAAVTALQATYTAAARAKQNELPLTGSFELGKGDPRFMLELTSGQVLGAAGLTGKILLPANFATNPFRHRRHPDHAAGYDITRKIRLDFDAKDVSGQIPSVSRGVKQVAGVYREEFFGLHKPLGQNLDVGLKTEGRFQLNRVSTISTLNGK